MQALIMASATPAAYFRDQNIQPSDTYGIRGLWSPSSVAESGRRGDRSPNADKALCCRTIEKPDSKRPLSHRYKLSICYWRSYFDHSIHVQKGMGCVTCHGRVDEMPLMWRQQSLLMEWCLECHREPERFVRPRAFVFSMDWKPSEDQLTLGRKLVQEYHIAKRTSCSVCHR